jgi:hypothetical protein
MHMPRCLLWSKCSAHVLIILWRTHWTIVKIILKYLIRTKEVFLVFGGDEQLVVAGYTDASFQIDTDGSKSQSSFVFCLNGGEVGWKSSKQDIVAYSTTEVKYIATSEAVKEIDWIKKLFLSWMLFLVHIVIWISIVTIVEP